MPAMTMNENVTTELLSVACHKTKNQDNHSLTGQLETMS